MVRPAERTRSRKRITTPLPSGRIGSQLKNTMSAATRCRMCGQLLGGSSKSSPLRISKATLSQKRILRLYGGQLCHNCLKTGLRQAARTTNV